MVKLLQNQALTIPYIRDLLVTVMVYYASSHKGLISPAYRQAGLPAGRQVALQPFIMKILLPNPG
jgi:hypothetical protein